MLHTRKAVFDTAGIAMLVLAFPIAALANVTGTPTLTAGTALSLDTGTTSASGGDILWSGTTMTPQSKAGAVGLTGLAGLSGAATFATLTQTTLSAFSSLYTGSTIPASDLAVNDIFAVHTNGGNYAAVLVTAVSGTSITIQFVTFVSAPTGPVITAVQNNYSNIPAGFPNSGIAQGALFYIVGTGLANPSASAVLQNSTTGLPMTLNGASVSVKSGSTTVTPAFYYAVATALGLVLPSNTPVGTAQVTVTYNGQTSAPFTIQVVASAMGFDTYSGTSEVVAQNPTTGALYSYTNSVPPSALVALWGAGLGADPTVDTTAVSGAFTINGLAHVYVGGIDAAIAYQGESGPGYPGVDEVFVTIPANAPTGCYVSLVGVTAAGLPTNFTTIPIGSGPCVETELGVTGTQIAGQSSGAVSTGFVAIAQETSPASSGSGTTTVAEAFAEFESTSGGSFSASGGSTVSIGGCVVNQTISSSGSPGSATGLNAGNITVTGPAGSMALSTYPQLVGEYSAMLPTGFLPASGGTFTFQGTGAAGGVGPFTATVTFPNPVLTWTNQAAAATVTRSAGLPITWAGGASGTDVYMSGGSSSGSNYGYFYCIAPVAAGQFTVPNYVLNALPAGMGSVTVQNETNYTSFSATGLNIGFASGFVSYDVNSTFN
jgi:uncharacterized protein (TIGR03437 family)